MSRKLFQVRTMNWKDWILKGQWQAQWVPRPSQTCGRFIRSQGSFPKFRTVWSSTEPCFASGSHWLDIRTFMSRSTGLHFEHAPSHLRRGVSWRSMSLSKHVKTTNTSSQSCSKKLQREHNHGRWGPVCSRSTLLYAWAESIPFGGRDNLL